MWKSIMPGEKDMNGYTLTAILCSSERDGWKRRKGTPIRDMYLLATHLIQFP